MKISFSLKMTLIAVLAFVLFPLTATAQKINGFIYDEHKKPLANVEIVNQTNNFVTISNENGHFAVKGNNKDILKFIYKGKLTKIVATTTIKNNKVYFDDKDKIEKNRQKETTKKLHKTTRKYNRKIKNTKIKDHRVNGNPFTNAVIGQIVDDHGPIPGANITIKGTTKGTQTDFNGFYGIDAKMGDVLVVSYIGMSEVRAVVNHKVMNIKLSTGSAALSEVVVTNLGYYKKEKIAMASSTIISKELEGKVSGVAVSTDAIRDKKIGFVSEDAEPTTTKAAATKAGQLTAGEVNDFSHYEYWTGLTESELNQWKNHWKVNPTLRYSISIKNNKGYPISNRTVHLKTASKIIWTARTDNTGRAELWFDPNELTIEKMVSTLQIVDDKNVVLTENPKEFHEGINNYTYNENCLTQNKINIAFMIDATGSMGDEINYLQAELFDVIERTKKQYPQDDVTMGSVFYRDHNDEYLVKTFDFTTSIPNVISFIRKQSADGGGDYPEAVIEGLEASIENMDWDDDARARLLFVLLDAPPHYSDENVNKLLNLSKKAAAKGIRIIPIAASGIDKSTEYLMRSMALETNGTYLFITNHSGIGNDHIEPSTESYKVEMLNDLILRVILQFTSANNCLSAESNYPINTKIEGHLNKNNAVNFKFYPNPTSDLITVTVDKEATELYLFDTTGKLILYKTEKSKEYRIDLSGLPNAIYYLRVLVEGRELFGKVVKRN